MPGKVIVFPGMTCCGFSSHASSVLSSQMMSEDASAGEYRVKLSTVPVLRFQRPARLGPLMFLLGFKEWHAAQFSKTFAPRDGLPSAAHAEACKRTVVAATSIGAFTFMPTAFTLQPEPRGRDCSPTPWIGQEGG